jgi:MFS family permease
MSHHKRSRVGHLPRWQRLSTHLIFAICALSGLGFFLKREMGIDFGDLQARSLLVWHGISAAFALLAFGAVLPGHIRSSWKARRNRASGIVMIAVMAGLMLSGLLLYYGDEEWHNAVLWTHWIGGFVAFAAFPLHLVLGHRANALRQPCHTKSRLNVGPSASALQ